MTTIDSTSGQATGLKRLERRLGHLVNNNRLIWAVVKSHAGQATVHALRAMTHLTPLSGAKLAVVTLVAPRRRGCYRLRGTGYEVCLRAGTEDIVSLNEQFHRRVYEFPREVLAVLPQGVGAYVAADLGANIGMFSVWLLSSRRPARIIAFEPDPSNVAALRSLRGLNQLDQLEIHAACAATAAGTVAFAAGDYMHSRVMESAEGATVSVPAVDVFPLIQDADLLKIDIEGSEWPLLADSRLRTLGCRAIAMEWHITDDHPVGQAEGDAERLLDEAGFNVVQRDSYEPTCGTIWAVRG